MRKVFKYALGYHTKLEVPENAQTLSFQYQLDNKGNPTAVLWMLVDTDSQYKEVREFILVGTGHDIPMENTLIFLGTDSYDGIYHHLFEVKKR